jgi:hypothetical protein
MEHLAVSTRPAAQIIVAGMKPISCTVAEISEQSATLRVASVFGIPEKFDVSIGAKHHQCRTIEKGTNKLKVVFES